MLLERLAFAHVTDVEHQARHIGVGEQVGGGELDVEPVPTAVTQTALDPGRRAGRARGDVLQLGLDDGGLLGRQEVTEGGVQDAGGIVEWNRRLQFLQKWFNAHFDDEKYTAEELRDFRKQTGITHILTDRIGPVELDPVFGNDTYDVYDLTTLD